MLIEAKTAEGKDNRAIRLSVSVSDVLQISRGDVAEAILAVTEDDLSSKAIDWENGGVRTRTGDLGVMNPSL